MGGGEGYHGSSSEVSVLVEGSGCLLKNMIVKVVIDIPLFHHCRSYEDPSPAFCVVSDNVNSLILGIQCSLRRGINLNCKFNVEFRLDVFSYLFSGKGSLPPSGKGKLYNLDDFNPTFFPINWFIVYDKLGNGCKVDFPVRLESKLKWSPALYDKLPNGTVVVRKKIFSEIVVVTLVKKRC